MGPELSRRLGRVLGRRPNAPQERFKIVDAAQDVETWDELPEPIRKLVEEIERRE